MRYRPFGQAGVSVSVVALALDDRAGQGGADALASLIFAGMEAGVNAFHIESCEPEVLKTIGQALATVERRLLFVSLRLGLRPGRTGLTRDFSPEALTGAIGETLTHTGLGHLDLVLLDEPGEDELPTAALTALKQQRTTGRVGLLGIGGAHDAMDAYLGVRAFDALATPHHLRSGWKELSRVKAATRMDMGVIAYDYFPEIFRQASTTPGVPQKRGLLDALAGVPQPHPLAGAGTYAFLHNTKSWTAEELCLAYALMETSVSTVLIRAHEPEHLKALAAVPDRDPPPSMAAQVEMARFGLEQAPGPASTGGVLDALKSIMPNLDGFSVFETYATLRSKPTDVADDASVAEAPGDKGGSKRWLRQRTGERGVARPYGRTLALSPPNSALLLPTPESPLGAQAVTPQALSRAGSGETSDHPLSAPTPAQPPPAAQPRRAQTQTPIWRSKDYDYPVQPTGESFPGPDGRTYLKVSFNGSHTFVPADEMIFPEDMTPPPLAPAVAREALQARAAASR